MYLDIVYIQMHSKIYVFRKAKTTYNLEQREYWTIQTYLLPLDSIPVLLSHFFPTGKSEHTLCVLSFPLQLVNLNPLVEVAYTTLVPPQILRKLSIALSVQQICKSIHLRTIAAKNHRNNRDR